MSPIVRLVPRYRMLGVGFLALTAIVTASCVTLEFECAECVEPCKPQAAVCEHPSIHALASDLDHLERQIDQYGSVVAKVPDVWGQARLTKYREEFEKLMSEEASKFAESLQGAVIRSDQAYFANAMALSAAVSSRQAGLFAPRPRVMLQSNNATNVEKNVDVIKPETATLEMGAFAAFDKIERTPLPGTKLPGYDLYAKNGVQLERTVFLEQKARYLNYLAQIRRTNEGDDTADSPGYSLNLVRIPVSILPGKQTDRAHGAEITFTLDSVIGDELLPTTFRQLVINDLVDLLAPPVCQSAWQNKKEIEELIKLGSQVVSFPSDKTVQDLAAAIEKSETSVLDHKRNIERVQIQLVQAKNILEEEYVRQFPKAAILFEKPFDVDGKEFRNLVALEVGNKTGILEIVADTPQEDVRRYNAYVADMWITFRRGMRQLEPKRDELNRLNEQVKDEQKKIEENKKHLEQLRARLQTQSKVASPNVINVNFSGGSSHRRIAYLAVPPSQLIDTLGKDALAQLIVEIVRQTRWHSNRAEDLYYLDVERALQEEINAGYRLLAPGGKEELWQFCQPQYQLAHAIRTHQVDRVESLRNQFFSCINPSYAPGQVVDGKTVQPIIPAKVALAWAVIVESALLNEKLNDDVREAASARNCGCLSGGVWHEFYGPCPLATAREAFAAYVRCRWPIHVFALDPVTQDQNIGDTFSMRREMQLALSLAFASGQINARSLTRFARRLELDLQTIALNRTHIGFSHGDNTFGWRFYPRMQTPDIESNATALVRDNLFGGPSKDALLKQHHLEPGIRECVAVVIMPSFIPSLKIEASSNWFKLTNPKHKEFSLTDAMRMSKLVKSVESCQGQIADVSCYRDGDLGRLMAKAKQLEARLPLQNQLVQVPNENTLGGFEMFSNGVTDLAPELRGWYGAPGLATDKAETCVFLVGNHFSVNQTKVVVGGRPLSTGNVEMLSRQVLRVTIPGPLLSAPSLARDGSGRTIQVVDIHVATPYGVSAALQVPATESKPTETKGATWKADKLEVGYVYSGIGIKVSDQPTHRPDAIVAWDKSGLGEVSPLTVKAKITLLADAFENDMVIPVSEWTKSFNGDKQQLTVDGKTFTDALFIAVGKKFGPQQVNPPAPITTKRTTLELLSADGKSIRKIDLTNSLTITWVHAPDANSNKP